MLVKRRIDRSLQNIRLIKRAADLLELPANRKEPEIPDHTMYSSSVSSETEQFHSKHNP